MHVKHSPMHVLIHTESTGTCTRIDVEVYKTGCLFFEITK